jgi:uncharacterized membrane protein
MNPCIQDERVRENTARIGILESRMNSVEVTLNKLLWAIFATLGTAVLTLLVLLLQLLGKGV